MTYTHAGLEDEVEIRIMSFCSAVVKSGYPLASAAELWLAEGHAACYARDVLQALRAQQHEPYYAVCYYRTYLIRNFAYANPR